MNVCAFIICRNFDFDSKRGYRHYLTYRVSGELATNNLTGRLPTVTEGYQLVPIPTIGTNRHRWENPERTQYFRLISPRERETRTIMIFHFRFVVNKFLYSILYFFWFKRLRFVNVYRYSFVIQ